MDRTLTTQSIHTKMLDQVVDRTLSFFLNSYQNVVIRVVDWPLAALLGDVRGRRNPQAQRDVRAQSG